MCEVNETPPAFHSKAAVRHVKKRATNLSRHVDARAGSKTFQRGACVDLAVLSVLTRGHKIAAELLEIDTVRLEYVGERLFGICLGRRRRGRGRGSAGIACGCVRTICLRSARQQLGDRVLDHLVRIVRRVGRLQRLLDRVQQIGNGVSAAGAISTTTATTMMMMVMRARLPLRLHLLLQLRHRSSAICCRVASRRGIARRVLCRTRLQELIGILTNTTNATAHTTSF